MLTATIVAALAVVGIGTGADANGQPRAVAAVPDGFQQYLTCLAQPREVDEPTVVDYESFKTFQAEVWGRDQDAIDALRAEAITFYAERFGLDFSEAAVQPDGSQSIHGATLVPSFVAPETEYRALHDRREVDPTWATWCGTRASRRCGHPEPSCTASTAATMARSQRMEVCWRSVTTTS